MKSLSERRIDLCFILTTCLVTAGFLLGGNSAHGQTLYVEEGASITAIKTPSGDLTTRAGSYLNEVTQAFSHKKECSGIKLQQNNKADFVVQFYLAHLLDQYTIAYVVANKFGSVINTATEHSIPGVAENVCELIKESRNAKCSPHDKGLRGGACDSD
ncbi:MAG TPA: hypothetical protein VEV41_18340, partial [Terriglobales bacterium]|nr:hypothetical protein [Terriglobales bacterium]